MKTLLLTLLNMSICITLIFNPVYAKSKNNILKEDRNQVITWNNFAAELYELHLSLTKDIHVSTTESTGGYGGSFANNNFYREISYFNREINQLISKIQWEIEQPDTIHTIEVFLYNKQGQVKTDFYARYLPDARNAPIQTLINLHNYNDNLHAFRQFDANGELIYETCRGQFFDTKINLHLDDEEILDFRNTNPDEMLEEAYNACFLNVAQTANNYLSPAVFITNNNSKQNLSRSIDSDIYN